MTGTSARPGEQIREVGVRRRTTRENTVLVVRHCNRSIDEKSFVTVKPTFSGRNCVRVGPFYVGSLFRSTRRELVSSLST